MTDAKWAVVGMGASIELELYRARWSNTDPEQRFLDSGIKRKLDCTVLANGLAVSHRDT